jgi:hypothetical protein
MVRIFLNDVSEWWFQIIKAYKVICLFSACMVDI